MQEACDGVPEGTRLKRIPVIGYKYAAGSDGHVYCYSTAPINSGKPQPFRLAERARETGYPHVAIIEGDRRRTVPVHILVCSAFHGEKPFPAAIVRHLDGDQANNTPDNLCWGTYAQNEADKRRHGRVAEGERHGQVKLTEEGVRIIRAAIPFGLWNAADAAKIFGVDPSTIRRVAAGKRDWKSVR